MTVNAARTVNGGSVNLGGWIPVTERLPEDNSHVLCVIAGEEVTVGMMQRNAYNGGRFWKDCLDAQLGDDGHTYTHIYLPSLKNVTHWQPIPAPPNL